MRSTVALIGSLSLAAAIECDKSQLDTIEAAFTSDATWGPTGNSTFSAYMDSKLEYWSDTCIGGGGFLCESPATADQIAVCKAKYDNYEKVERPALIKKVDALFAPCTLPTSWPLLDEATSAKKMAYDDWGMMLQLNCPGFEKGVVPGGGGGDPFGGGENPFGGGGTAGFCEIFYLIISYAA